MTATGLKRTPAPAGGPRPARSAGAGLAGLGALLRLALIRDRVRLPVWALGITAAVAGMAASFPSIYPGAEDRAGALVTIDNPGTTALIGAVYGADDYTYGIMVGHQLLALTAVAAGLMSIFTFVRHTRGEEESGRAELVRSSVTGRHAQTAVGLVMAVGANLALAVALTVGLGALGVETIDWSGSLLFGIANAAVGVVFVGVAAVTVQLTENARTASSSAGLILALAYVLRAIGDVRSETISWLSPIGWSQATEVYHSDDWQPLAVAAVATVVLVTAGIVLSTRRDVGAGILGSRPGPAEAGAALNGPFGLTWRLARGTLIGWALGVFAFGLIYGPVLSEADTFLEDLPAMADFLPDADASGAELFGGTIVAVAAIVCAVPALQVILRLRAEEEAGRAGPLLATPLSRLRWMTAGLVLAVLGGAGVLVAMGLGVGLGAGMSMSDMSWVGSALVAALSYLPATAVAIGLAALLLGCLPRATGFSWVVVVLGAIVLYFGGTLDLPQWVINLSPFSHVPQQPAADFDAVPLLGLAGTACAAMAIGLIGIRRRNLTET